MTRPLCAGLAASMLVLLIGALFGVIPAACTAAGMTLLFVLRKNAALAHRVLCVALVGWALASVTWHFYAALLPSSRLDGALAMVEGKVVSVSRSGELFQTAIVRLDSVTTAGVTTHPRTRLSLVLTTAVIYIPFLAEAFGFEHISLAEYFVALGLAFLVIPLVEIIKLITRLATRKKS